MSIVAAARNPVIAGIVLGLAGCAFPYFGSNVAPPMHPAPPSPAVSAPVDENAYVVAKGDTLYAISKRSGVRLRALIELNSLTPPYRIHPGDRLKLPAPVKRPVPGPSAPVKSAPPKSAATKPAPIPGANASANAPVNAPADSSGEDRKFAYRDKAAPVAEGSAISGIAAPEAPGAEAATEAGAATATPELATLEPTAPEPEAEVPAPLGKPFIWPARGKILSGFGSKPGGLHNDGINIAAAKGAPVRAVAPGEVAYVGSDLEGFGNLLLIKHDDGWISAYAHAERILVSKGQHVGRGSIVARVGRTGNVSRTQLHFEIRRGTKPVDPIRYLPPLG